MLWIKRSKQIAVKMSRYDPSFLSFRWQLSVIHYGIERAMRMMSIDEKKGTGWQHDK
jgi:hypothetical protein